MINFLASWGVVDFMINCLVSYGVLLMSWRTFWCHEVHIYIPFSELFEVLTYFWHDEQFDVFWRHDELFVAMTNFFGVTTCFWCHDELFDVMRYIFTYLLTNVLRSWCFTNYLKSWGVFLTLWRTFWHHDVFLTSWETFWCYGVFLMSRRTSWCQEVHFDVMT